MKIIQKAKSACPASTAKNRRARGANHPKRQKKIWTPEEDQILLGLIERYGPAKWSTISGHMVGRQGKQCRERWHNHLNPEILKSCWKEDEEWRLFLLHKLYGNKWAILAQMIQGRTDNTIKNHWNSIMKRKIKSFESKLAETIKNSETRPPMGRLESVLLQRIANGDFDSHSCKKGRKSNYTNFFEKNLLEEFVVRKNNFTGLVFPPVELPLLGVPEAAPHVERTPRQSARKNEMDYLLDTRTNPKPHPGEEPAQQTQANTGPKVALHDEKFSFGCFLRSSPEKANEYNFFDCSLSKYFRKNDEMSATSNKKGNYEASNYKLINPKSPQRESFKENVDCIPVNWDL